MFDGITRTRQVREPNLGCSFLHTTGEVCFLRPYPTAPLDMGSSGFAASSPPENGHRIGSSRGRAQGAFGSKVIGEADY